MDNSEILIALSALVILLILARLAKAVVGRREGKLAICTLCGHLGRTKMVCPGSAGMEIILFLALVLPGIFYALFREANEYEGCACCGSRDVVPPDSPRGGKLQMEYYGEQ